MYLPFSSFVTRAYNNLYYSLDFSLVGKLGGLLVECLGSGVRFPDDVLFL